MSPCLIRGVHHGKEALGKRHPLLLVLNLRVFPTSVAVLAHLLKLGLGVFGVVAVNQGRAGSSKPTKC